jgi:hypothetical protein
MPFPERFELKSQAGVGGMGTVYKALDRETGGVVAVKILQARGMTDAARFDQEAALLRELLHPGIVRYVDHGVTAHGDPYIAMEWLEGETLERRLLRGALPPRLVVALARRVLEALAAAHGRGVVHRDIKPSNIFLVGWRLDDVRILDFGIARRLFDQRRFTRQGSMVGTPLYSAPEQARGDRTVDARADVFSLGCVLFECLTGEPPFTAGTPQEVMALICTGTPPDVRARRPGLDEELARLVDEMLCQDRKRRPGDALALAERFAAVGLRLGADGQVESAVGEPRRPGEALGGAERRILVALRLAFEPPVVARAAADELLLAGRRAGPLRVDAGGSVLSGAAPAVVMERVGRAQQALAGIPVQVERLFDRSLVVLASVAGPPADQAEVVARAALRARDAFPDAYMTMAMGRALLLDRMPVGPIVERLSAIGGSERGAVFVDAQVARLLRKSYRLWEERESVFLLAPAERTGLDASGAPDATEPFGGRERELRNLLGLVDQSADEEVARAAIVVGGPGLGKSRLRRELVRRLVARTPQPQVVVLRPPREGLGPAGAGSFGYLRGIIGAEAAFGGELPGRAQELLLVGIEGRLAHGPVVIVCEDLHAAERGSAAALDAALRTYGARPLSIIGFARAEIDEMLPGLWRERSAERIRLVPLPRRTGQTLIGSWMPEAPPDLETFALDRWEGNPFFLRELVAAAAAGERETPASVLGTVEARLATLADEARRVLRAASLFGETFSTEAVASVLGPQGRALVDEQLPVLAERDLVQPAGGGRPETFAFGSRLVREAAFHSLTPGDRAIGEKLVRKWIEGMDQTFPEAVAVDPARL